MKIKIAVADTDLEYVSRFMNALSSETNLSLSMFTDKNSFTASMLQGKYDIVIADPSMLNDQPNLKNVKLTVVLFDDEYQGDITVYSRYKTVRKYQRASNLYKEVLGYYAEIAATSMSYSMNGKCSVICVYSPVGGCGKTTVAVSIADLLANRGLNALYFGFEPISSYGAVFDQKTGKGIGELIGSLDSNINFDIKIESLLRRTDRGVLYFEDFENILDIYEVTVDDMEKLISVISASGLCDYLIIDMGTEYSRINREIMELADKVIIVESGNDMAKEKMKRLFSRKNLFRNFEDKIQIVLNRVSSQEKSITDYEVVGRLGKFEGNDLEVFRAMSRSRLIDIEKIKQ